MLISIYSKEGKIWFAKKVKGMFKPLSITKKELDKQFSGLETIK
jgi:hypothetical protein